MKLLPIVFLIAGPVACFVNPPAEDSAAFLCDDKVDCADGYECNSRDGGAKICVSETPCGNAADCPEGFSCEGNPARCWPRSGCAESSQCPPERPICDNGACVDPCAGDPCANETELFCVPDPATKGHQCVPCSVAGCPDGLVCVELGGANQGCRPGCGAASDSCAVNTEPGKCGFVPAYDPVSHSPKAMLACVKCPSDCVAAGCVVPTDPSGTLVPWPEAGGCSCATNNDCLGDERCVVRDGQTNTCAIGCDAAGNVCTIPGPIDGRCTPIRTPNGALANVCVSCEMPCSTGAECVVVTDGQDRLEEARRECFCDPSVCITQGAGYRCIPAATPLAGEDCSNVCGTGQPACPTPTTCEATVCAPPTANCNDGTLQSPPEACDDNDLNGGWCRADCSGPECTWGLVFDAATGANNVDFGTSLTLNMGANFTIDFLLQIEAGASGSMPVLRKKQDGTNPGYRIYWENGTLYAEVSDGATVKLVSTNLASGDWKHVALVRTATPDSLAWFVDGALAGTLTPTTLGASLGNSMPLVLGTPTNNPPLPSANFSVDDLRLWNRALVQSDLATPRTCAHSADANLVGEWLFDYALTLFNGGVIADTSGNNPPGTPSGPGVFGANVP